jgi:hypothetical protein
MTASQDNHARRIVVHVTSNLKVFSMTSEMLLKLMWAKLTIILAAFQS